MKKPIEKIDIGVMAPIFLFALFALSILIVLLTGASSYKQFTDRDFAGNSRRTAEQYISARVRQSKEENAYFIGDFETKKEDASGNTFFIREKYGEEEYYTCIYAYEGQLYELFFEKGASVDMEDGEKIAKLNALSFLEENGRLQVNITHLDGSQRVMYFNMQRGGAPQ